VFLSCYLKCRDDLIPPDMKLIVLSVLSCLLSVLVYGQEVVVSGGAFAVAPQRCNIAYEGVRNNSLSYVIS
jgi:hypothetical protein